MKYYCPHCKSEKIIDYGNSFQCVECNSVFSKEFIGKIKDSNVLCTQDLDKFMDAFDELKDKKKREDFLKTLKEDFH